MQEVVKSVVRADGKRRIEIEKRPDGHFSFAVDKLVYHYDEELRKQLNDYELVWVPAEFGGIYDTKDHAEQEAESCESWKQEE